MKTREIPNEQWESFLSDFYHLHMGKHVNVETLGQGLGVRMDLHDVPLLAMVTTSTESQDAIELLAADVPQRPRIYAIVRPRHLRVAEEENGQTIALQIESADGSVTLVRFEPSHEGFPAGFKLG